MSICKQCGHRGPDTTLGARCPHDGAVLIPEEVAERYPQDPVLGRVIGGKYAVVGVLGIGGFGAVYRAIQEPVGRPVALKVILPRSENQKTLQARFFREARIVCQLRDPATVVLHDYGEDGDGRLYMVFELLEGETLESVIAHGPMEPLRVGAVLLQILGALAEAHRLGTVHRDLKPGNVMLVQNSLGEESVKVLDFGIAKVTGVRQGEASIETMEGVILGTPKYMAPEQARGGTIDSRTDLYALGALGYALLTGHPPFSTGSALEILLRQMQERPRAFDPALNVPPGLQAVIEKALSKDPAERFQTAEEMARAVIEAFPGRPLSTANYERRAILAAAATVTAMPTPSEVRGLPTVTFAGNTSREFTGDASGAPSEVSTRASRRWLGLAAAGVVGVGGLALLLAVRPPAGSTSRVATAHPHVVAPALADAAAATVLPSPLPPEVPASTGPVAGAGGSGGHGADPLPPEQSPEPPPEPSAPSETSEPHKAETGANAPRTPRGDARRGNSDSPVARAGRLAARGRSDWAMAVLRAALDAAPDAASRDALRRQAARDPLLTPLLNRIAAADRSSHVPAPPPGPPAPASEPPGGLAVPEF